MTMKNIKKNSAAIVWGVLFLAAAVGLLFYAIMPELAIFTVPLWKWLIAAVLVYWIVRRLVFAKSLVGHFDFFIPLALLFLLFEREIGAQLGKGADFVHNGYVILAAVLLTVAFYLILGWTRKRVSTASSGVSACGDNRFRSGICYIDANSGEPQAVNNKMGSLGVYFQNADVGDVSRDVVMRVNNDLGSIVVHVPANWEVVSTVKNDMGSVSIRDNQAVTIRRLIIDIENHMGSVSVISD